MSELLKKKAPSKWLGAKNLRSHFLKKGGDQMNVYVTNENIGLMQCIIEIPPLLSMSSLF